MSLAIFDLDNTLLAGDSDYLWGEFLIEQGLVDGDHYRRENQRFYDEYKTGTLDIFEFLEFSLAPLARMDMETLNTLHREFMRTKIDSIMLPAAQHILNQHRERGDILLIITATNRFVTQPIAERLDVDHLLATDPEVVDQRYTGRVSGTPCFKEGKVTRLNQWLKDNAVNLSDSWFYSDSHNDLPLLELVNHPIAVDPDDTLKWHAEQKNWKIISLRNGSEPSPSPL
ncbi:histidinol-phosphatase [Kaarinaea lacus]